LGNPQASWQVVLDGAVVANIKSYLAALAGRDVLTHPPLCWTACRVAVRTIVVSDSI
jgi:hypothetical protein